MSNNLPAVFSFESHEVRTVEKAGEVWFFAQDVAATLGYSSTNALMKRIEDDEQEMQSFLNGATYTKQSLINESGLYNAIFGSQLDTAKRFKKWVTSEVLPAIRKTGKYDKDTPIMIISRALVLANDVIEQKDAYIAELEPQAAFYKAVSYSADLILIREAAKILAVPHLGQNTLYTILRGCHILMENNEPYQEYMNRGYFMVKERQYTVNGEIKVSRTTMLTQKGLEFIRRLVIANMEGGFFKKGPANWVMPPRADKEKDTVLIG